MMSHTQKCLKDLLTLKANHYVWGDGKWVKKYEQPIPGTPEEDLQLYETDEKYPCQVYLNSRNMDLRKQALNHVVGVQNISSV